MKLFTLLEGLYRELKTFNENVEYFSLLESEKRRRRENPLKNMTDVEKVSLKLWINKRLEAENITLNGDLYTERAAMEFLRTDDRHGRKSGRDFLSAALGYDSFNALLDAYAQAKGGAA